MKTATVSDILPEQDCYFGLHDGEQPAIFGPNLNELGLLVFTDLEHAEEFHELTTPYFKETTPFPTFDIVEMPAEKLIPALVKIGYVCLWNPKQGATVYKVAEASK